MRTEYAKVSQNLKGSASVESGVCQTTILVHK